MASEPRTQRLILGGLLAALALVVWWSVGGDDVPVPARSARPVGKAQVTPRETLTAGVGLSRLTRVPASLSDGGRDPFAEGRETRGATGPGEDGQGASSVPHVVSPQPEGPVVPLPPPGPPPPPPIVVRFIGVIERDDVGRLAVLSDGKTVYYGREGAIVDGRWRIVRIGEESLQIEYVDGRGRQTVRLTG